MTKQNLLTISVFSNESMSECLDSYKSDGKIYEIEDDLQDNDDWWIDYADDAEYKFGSTWSTILIKTEDESRGRVIDRNYYLNGEIINSYFVYHDKLFLIGESSSTNLSTFFSGHIIFNYQLNERHDVKYYQKGYDYTLIALIKEFMIFMFHQAKVVDVVYNPNPKSILAMKLSDDYKFMVHLSTKDKVHELIGLVKAMDFTSRVHYELLRARRISNGYGTHELDFMTPMIEEIENKIDLNSDISFYKSFEKKFCV